MPLPITHHDFNDLVQMFKTGQAGLSAPTLEIHLFVNNIVPDCHVLVSDFVECADATYLPIPVLPGDWTFADYPISGDCGRQSQTGIYVYLFAVGGFTVYGCWIEDTANGVIAWVQRFDAPFAFPAGAGSMTVQLFDVQQQCP